MTLEKKSITAIVLFFSVLTISLGLLGFGITETQNWLIPLATIVGGMILFFEVGFKIFANFHRIKTATAMQYISLVFGSLAILIGALTIPFVNITWEWLRVVGSSVLIVIGVLILAEWFTQRS